MHFDPTVQGDDSPLSKSVQRDSSSITATSEKPDVQVASTPDSIPRATFTSVLNPNSPSFTYGKIFADSAPSPAMTMCSPENPLSVGPSDVAEVADMFSELSLSPESPPKKEDVELVCVSPITD